MSIDRLISRNPLACALVLVHTLLWGACVWIELDDAWNDMNPTMAVGMAMYAMDVPIHWLPRSGFEIKEINGIYAATVLFLGTAMWFTIGMLITLAFRGLRRISIRKIPLTNGV